MMRSILAFGITARVQESWKMRQTDSLRAEFDWLISNADQIYARYEGKWIAVVGSEVVGIGPTAVAAADDARSSRPDHPFLLEFVDRASDIGNVSAQVEAG